MRDQPFRHSTNRTRCFLLISRAQVAFESIATMYGLMVGLRSIDGIIR